MSILRCFVRWYVWWGRNAFHYYSRPFVWTILFLLWMMDKPGPDPLQIEENIREAQCGFVRASQEHYANEQLRGARIVASVDIKIAQQNLRDVRRLL